MDEQQVKEEILKSTVIDFLTKHYNYKIYILNTLSIDELFDDIERAYDEGYYDPVTKEKLIEMRNISMRYGVTE